MVKELARGPHIYCYIHTRLLTLDNSNTIFLGKKTPKTILISGSK